MCPRTFTSCKLTVGKAAQIRARAFKNLTATLHEFLIRNKENVVANLSVSLQKLPDQDILASIG